VGNGTEFAGKEKVIATKQKKCNKKSSYFLHFKKNNAIFELSKQANTHTSYF
jgi:hypothetical protein